MISSVIDRIRAELISTFAEVSRWLREPDVLLDYTPASGGWNGRKILEHILLTNHYLLVLIRKGTAKALQKAANKDYSAELCAYHFDWEGLEEIGLHGSFYWNRPAHMEPAGDKTAEDLKAGLKQQLEECLLLLGQLSQGQGVLYKIMMSVHSLGKIDMYHYLYFLCQHAKRHLVQLQLVQDAFTDRQTFDSV